MVGKSTFVDISLTVLYVALIIYALIARFGRTHPRTKMVHQYCMLVIVGSVLRALYFGVPPKIDHESFQPSNRNDHGSTDWWIGDFGTFVVFSCGSWFFFSQYCLIVYFWAQAFFSTRRMQIQRRPTQFFAACVILYGLALVTMYGLFAKYELTQILSVYSAVSLTLSVLVAVGFLTFWTKLSAALGQNNLLQDGIVAVSQARKMHKIASVAIAGASAATIRACVLGYQMVASAKDALQHEHFWWIIVFVFYLTSELSCSFAILFVLRKRPADAHVSDDSRGERTDTGRSYTEDSYGSRTSSPYTSLYDDTDDGGGVGGGGRYGTTDEFASPALPLRADRQPSDSPMWESPYFSPT